MDPPTREVPLGRLPAEGRDVRDESEVAIRADRLDPRDNRSTGHGSNQEAPGVD